jgi:zinc-ribbon domain
VSVAFIVGALLAVAALGVVLYPLAFHDAGAGDPDQPPAPQPTSAGCPSCGAPVRTGARFCSNCGGRLPESVA